MSRTRLRARDPGNDMDPSYSVTRPPVGGGLWLRQAAADVLGASVEASLTEGVPASFLAVLITEIGDKTFFLAMLLSMRHGKLAVFVGTMCAMFIMTLGSSLAGYLASSSAENAAASTVVWMDFLAAVLFGVFSAQLFRDAYNLHLKERGDQEVRSLLGGEDSNTHGELLDAEETLQEAEEKDGEVQGWWGGVRRTFAMMFVAEWGDRSMFATMALATQHDPVGVIAGAMLAHALANSLAVIGGEYLGKRISEKAMSITGGCVFGVFALGYLYDGAVDPAAPW